MSSPCRSYAGQKEEATQRQCHRGHPACTIFQFRERRERGPAPETPQPYDDRRHAGAVLASTAGAFQGRNDIVVLGLPRGGVPVAHEVARALEAPLDVFLVRKLGVPGHRELAMGAIASGVSAF